MSLINNETSFILIVDDNPTNLEVLAKTLDDAGFNIRIEVDGASALELLEEDEHPELILLDVQMPGIDGFETCRRIKMNPKTQDIPIIFMTALADTESKVKGLSLGAVDYISKPFEGQEVLARVKVHLQIRYLTKTLQQWNEDLEQRVRERTKALETAQVQLVQQEKFATMGQLVAGVAHEVNNPIGCITNNIAPAHDFVANITKMIRIYQKYCTTLIPEIEQSLEELDIEFALLDLPKLLHSMKLSAERIKDISVSLRNFSRLDITNKELVSLHAGLDSTLMILQHHLKCKDSRPAIEVIKQYGAIPEIQCYAGQLNQVFMNLLANAIDAVRDVTNPKICISTEMPNSTTIVVRIADNGTGMSEEVKKRLFEPLFTTKPVGKGTGLGLSIAKQIVEEKHGGKLSFESYLGKGTEFYLNLPIN
ncbi:MAG: hybrid sensor histidine kinase/response regulator [Calothrix sp. FI2-JRJ7]|jgi:signal transduction histidine kinase|nr:hybrid sensor histidine kinase/response regulator [Calothrix sp. FI2-JRJ7]